MSVAEQAVELMRRRKAVVEQLRASSDIAAQRAFGLELQAIDAEIEAIKSKAPPPPPDTSPVQRPAPRAPLPSEVERHALMVSALADVARDKGIAQLVFASGDLHINFVLGQPSVAPLTALERAVDDRNHRFAASPLDVPAMEELG